MFWVASANQIENYNSGLGISLVPPENDYSREANNYFLSKLFPENSDNPPIQQKEESSTNSQDRKDIPNFLQVWDKNQDKPIQQKEESSANSQDRKDITNFLQVWDKNQNSTPIQQKQADKKEPENFMIQMQKSFQTDFSNVNIHKNSETAEKLGALAYTQGNDVYFAPRQFKPDTQKGKELIGHEFAHVVQQRQGKVQPNKQIGKFKINDNSVLEKEADEMGKKVANNQLISKINNTEQSEKNLLQLKTKDDPPGPIIKNGIIVGYITEDGQDIFQIVTDINQRADAGEFFLPRKITYLDIIISNPVELNLNAGDKLEIEIVDLKKSLEWRAEDGSLLHKGVLTLEMLSQIDNVSYLEYNSQIDYSFDESILNELIDFYDDVQGKKIPGHEKSSIECCHALYEGIKIAVDIPDWKYRTDCKDNLPDVVEMGLMQEKETYLGKQPDDKIYEIPLGLSILDYVRENTKNQEGVYIYALGISGNTHMMLMIYENIEEEMFYLADQGTCWTTDSYVYGDEDKSGIAMIPPNDIQSKIESIMYSLWSGYANRKNWGKYLNIWRLNKIESLQIPIDY